MAFSEFEAMKMLSGRKAPCGDKHQFCAKMTASEYTQKPFSRYHSSLNKEEYEKWHFRYAHFCVFAVFRVAFGHLYESCWSQKQRGSPGA